MQCRWQCANAPACAGFEFDRPADFKAGQLNRRFNLKLNQPRGPQHPLAHDAAVCVAVSCGSYAGACVPGRTSGAWSHAKALGHARGGSGGVQWLWSGAPCSCFRGVSWPRLRGAWLLACARRTGVCVGMAKTWASYNGGCLCLLCRWGVGVRVWVLHRCAAADRMACSWVKRQYYRYNNVTPLAMLDWWEKLLFSTSHRHPAVAVARVRRCRLRGVLTRHAILDPGRAPPLWSLPDSVVLAGAAVSAYFLSTYAPDAIAAIQARAASVAADSQ